MDIYGSLTTLIVKNITQNRYGFYPFRYSMKMKLKLFLALLTLGVLFGCGKTEEDPEVITKYIGCTKALEGQGDCIRWMDRKIYFAFANSGTPLRNNEIHKGKVKEALKEIEENTLLGAGYFQYQEVDESLLQPIIEPGLSPNQYRSFILIWPDEDFNDYVVNNLGGNVPDPNAITVINSAYKRKFFMIIRASCFQSQAACNSITTPGLNALIARQLGLLTGISPVDCDEEPNNVMCSAFPTDAQWNEQNKQRWFSTENNILEVILNNSNFYDEYVPSGN